MKKQLLNCNYKPSAENNPDFEIVEGVVKDAETGVHYMAAYAVPIAPGKDKQPGLEIYWGPNFVAKPEHPTHKRSASKRYIDGKKIPQHWAEVRDQLKEKLEAALNK